MKELRDDRAVRGVLREIAGLARSLPSPVRVMEVCGTHTMSLFRHGLTPLLAGAGVEMVSGPGCPVCITPNVLHEAAIGLLSGREGLTLATFGDMTRVPTRRGSLQAAVPARNSRLKVVYSPEEALAAARSDPGRETVFFGAGFETTIPAIAMTVKEAKAERLGNFSVLRALWLIPPALRALLASGRVGVAGFLYPGHVSAIIGLRPYAFVAEEFGVPGAVAGFEPGDILLAVRSVLGQAAAGKPEVALEYARAVRPGGNPVALKVMAEVFEPCDATWRGLGTIPASGLRFRPAYAELDAAARFGLATSGPGRDMPGCRCGAVLRAVLQPDECPLFGGKCTPESPLGPCMVSYEGACLIHYKYGRGPGAGGRA
ncbi:MAG TPA: hydrogenase formation protein HypD [Terriglobales bacterium]|nr:hydrogenase formation protein HypD [Terriglobales bacterium]